MINDFSVDMNEYLPLRDVVFNTLRKAILKGELKPGERLMEIALAERLGDNRRLNQVLNNLREQIYRYRVEYLKDEETRNLLVKEHEEIYEAIRNRDVKQAQEISYQHIENQREAIIRSIREETQNRQVHK